MQRPAPSYITKDAVLGPLSPAQTISIEGVDCSEDHLLKMLATQNERRPSSSTYVSKFYSNNLYAQSYIETSSLSNYRVPLLLRDCMREIFKSAIPFSDDAALYRVISVNLDIVPIHKSKVSEAFIFFGHHNLFL